MNQQCPLSMAELTARSKPSGYNAARSFKYSLNIAMNEVSAGQTAKDRGDIESAFIHFAKACTLLTDELPSHPRYAELEQSKRDVIIYRGQEVEIWLNETRALVGRRILDWKLQHLDIPSTPRSRVQSETGVSQARAQLNVPGSSLRTLPSPSNSAPLLSSSPSQHNAKLGHRRTSSDVGHSSPSQPKDENSARSRSHSTTSRTRSGRHRSSNSYSQQGDPISSKNPTSKSNRPTPTIVVRQATIESPKADKSSTPPTEDSNQPASSISASDTPPLSALTLTDISGESSPSQLTIDEPTSIATPTDITSFPTIQSHENTDQLLHTSSDEKPGRPRTLSETIPSHDQHLEVEQKAAPSEQRPGSCPPITTSDSSTNNAKESTNNTPASNDIQKSGAISEFFTAPLAIEMALAEGMDVSSDPEHPESIAKLEEEAVSYLELEQFERATNVLLDVLSLRRRVQGDDHLFTIQTMSNLGLGYEGQGKLDQAIEVLAATLQNLEQSRSAINLRFRSSIKQRIAELRLKQEEAKRVMTVVRFSSLKGKAKRNNSVDQIATRVRFEEDLPLHIDMDTTPEAIMAHLTNRRCPNLTDWLDILRCSKVPVNRGGFGDIWQGTLVDGRTIAMKRIYQGERKLNKRLAQELYAWSKADHPNVLELLGLAYYRDYLVMVSPWMQYGSVHDYLERNPEANRLHMAIQVADGIAHLHRIGMVHGDLKAQNIFVSHEGTLKVGDFGLAVMLGERSVAFQPSTTGSTPQGTIRWMAPELFDGSSKINISMKSDIYSLGMTIYEIVSCRLPFWELDNPMAVMAAVYLHKKLPSFPPQVKVMGKRGLILWDILCSCWNHDPSKRPTANQVLREMHKVASH